MNYISDHHSFHAIREEDLVIGKDVPTVSSLKVGNKGRRNMNIFYE